MKKINKPLGLSLIVSALTMMTYPLVATAQSASQSLSPYQRGYGLARNQWQNGIDPSTRDDNNNRVLIDGALVGGVDNSVYASSRSFGSYDGHNGISGVSAIGNNLQVIVTGNYNVVTVNSKQINNGTVTANSSGELNGQINLHGQ